MFIPFVTSLIARLMDFKEVTLYLGNLITLIFLGFLYIGEVLERKNK